MEFVLMVMIFRAQFISAHACAMQAQPTDRLTTLSRTDKRGDDGDFDTKKQNLLMPQ